MYTPDTFREDQLPLMHELMRQYSFALLATAEDNVPTVTHLPVILEASEGEYGTLYAHLARANPQWKHFANETESLVVFQGPHAYISPNWYADNPSVPTWNYAAVHAYGVPHILEQGDLLQLLHKLTTVYEQDFESPWSVDSLPEPYFKKMLKSIVGFKMEITRLDGKWKMSQNRSERDIILVAESLASLGDSNAEQVASMILARFPKNTV